MEKIIHYPEWNKYGRSAGFRRNSKIVDDSDELIAFWNLVSRGTKDTIEKANKKGIPVIIIDVNRYAGAKTER